MVQNSGHLATTWDIENLAKTSTSQVQPGEISPMFFAVSALS